MERCRCGIRGGEFALFRTVERDVDKVEIYFVNGSVSLERFRHGTLLLSKFTVIQLRLDRVVMTREGDVGLLVVFCDGGAQRGCSYTGKCCQHL